MRLVKPSKPTSGQPKNLTSSSTTSELEQKIKLKLVGKALAHKPKNSFTKKFIVESVSRIRLLQLKATQRGLKFKGPADALAQLGVSRKTAKQLIAASIIFLQGEKLENALGDAETLLKEFYDPIARERALERRRKIKFKIMD
jgi:hypothetical protein